MKLKKRKGKNVTNRNNVIVVYGLYIQTNSQNHVNTDEIRQISID